MSSRPCWQYRMALCERMQPGCNLYACSTMMLVKGLLCNQTTEYRSAILTYLTQAKLSAHPAAGMALCGQHHFGAGLAQCSGLYEYYYQIYNTVIYTLHSVIQHL